MRNTFYSETLTGAARHASRPFSLLETILIEGEAKDGKTQTERVIWTWKVHGVALQEASQREGMLIIGSNEPLLKKVRRKSLVRHKRSYTQLGATVNRSLLYQVLAD